MTTAAPAAGPGWPEPAAPAPARLRIADLARLAAVGLATRKLRAALSALGIAIGVAAIVAVLGLSASSAAGLNAEIAALGTNLLTVQNGQTFAGGTAELPTPAPRMIARLPGVTAVQDTGQRQRRQRLQVPATSTRSRPTRCQRGRRHLAPAQGGQHLARAGQVPQRRHGQGTRLRAGRGGRAADGHRPDLARRADLGRRHVVLRHRDPQARGAGPGHRLQCADRLPGRREVPGLRRASLHHLRQGCHQPGPGGGQPSGRPGQPGKPVLCECVPDVGRAHRPAQDQGGVQYPVPGPGRGGAAGRRDRGGQHHGHLRPRTPLRDRAAPRPGRDQGPHPHPVPVRGDPARGHRRHRRRRRRRGGHRRVRPAQGLGHRHSARGVAGGIAAAVLIGALAGLLPAIRAARLSPTQALWSI